MAKTWIISDTHFSHANMLTFTKDNEEPLRPFSSVTEMNEYMITAWNERVSNKDRVYHLGDFAMSRQGLRTIAPKLKGRIALIKGNHDIFKLKDYVGLFDDIRSMVVNPKLGMILSHVPLHPSSLYKMPINVHGHTHDREVMLDEVTPDYRYINVSVEQTNYAPVNMEELKELVEMRKGILRD